jgi:murein DD-endopeptidase MepM/ murein hydrolase activator NlpD
VQSASGTAPGSVSTGSSFDQILGLLAAPPNTGVEKPSLQHFRPPVAALRVPQAVGGGAGRTSPDSGPVGLAGLPLGTIGIALGGSILFAVLLVAAAPRLTPRRLHRLPELIAALPVGAVAVVTIVMLAPRWGALSSTAEPPAASTPPAVAHVAPLRAPGTLSPGVQLWQRLSAIEDNVARLETRLTVQTMLARQTGRDDLSVQPPRSRSADPQAAAQHTAGELELALEQEYQFYTATVQDPAAQQELVAAANTAAGGVSTVVTYNLKAVQTQLAQEAAITAAQHALPNVNGPAPTKLVVPMSGAISQPFGPSDLTIEPPLTFNGITYPHFHTGVDIAAPLDSPVVAAADGVVVIAGSSTDSNGHLVGYGNYVVIAHSGRMVTLYGHLDKLLVQAGQTVHAGDPVGLEGSTGYSTGPHLHFEVRIAGLLTDPMAYLSRGAR